jgi:hypothetical protein
MFRKSLLVAFTVASIGFIGQPANAKERDLGKLAPDSDKLVGLCNEHNGKTWNTGDNWDAAIKAAAA